MRIIHYLPGNLSRIVDNKKPDIACLERKMIHLLSAPGKKKLAAKIDSFILRFGDGNDCVIIQ